MTPDPQLSRDEALAAFVISIGLAVTLAFVAMKFLGAP